MCMVSVSAGLSVAGSVVSLLFGVGFGATVAWAAIKLPDKPMILLGIYVRNDGVQL